ncbi:MAG: hypothetical protein JXM70_16365 [Pirellulales bacterium]|nr:hypothetical protein [Pirellulales bacterium]
MKNLRPLTLLIYVQVIFALALTQADGSEPMLPSTTLPIVYTIDYGDVGFKNPNHIDKIKTAPPDLLHVGKAVPISHHWGPICLYRGENQYTGGPGNTLDRKNIALLTPAQLAERIEHIRETLKRYHEIDVSEVTPYISYHTLAGDHQKRLGFWEFYDNWNTYSRWAGPRPLSDPFEWLVVDSNGKFVGGSCGGYSPSYYKPLHRYRACINHPDWAEWHRRLMRMVAEVGYDGCFIDNTHPDICYCSYCKADFQKFLNENRQIDWVRRLTKGFRLEDLKLDSPGMAKQATSRELARRWRAIRTSRHLGMIRAAGREVKADFTIFPNSGNIHECLLVGEQCDRLMFESTFSPGLYTARKPPDLGDIAIDVSTDPSVSKRYTHRFELNDSANFIELAADITIPTIAQVGNPVDLEVTVKRVGCSIGDGDAAEELYLILREADGGKRTRLDLRPKEAVGGTGSSRMPVQPPATLKATWTPKAAGRYLVYFGFRYTDDGHVPEVKLRPTLSQLVDGNLCRSHQAELLFTQHMHARTIYLGYEAMKSGWENVQELSLAEMAAFSGGGGFSGRGRPQAEYRDFFKKHAQLFDGWRQTAPAAILYSYWGPNPLAPQRPHGSATISARLGGDHRLFVALVDANLPKSVESLSEFKVIYLVSASYELSPLQLASLNTFVERGGQLVLGKDVESINGRPAAEVLAETVTWDLASPYLPTPSIAPVDGPRRNLRFALYRKGDSLALHVVNYNICLLDKTKKVIDVPPTPIEVPLPSGWKAVTATCFDPDADITKLECIVVGAKAHMTLPQTHVYKVVLLEKP